MRHALDAAAEGLHVFPLRPGTKRPALHGLTHCPRTGPCAGGHLGWEQRATTDPDVVRRCWSAGPFNIGVATGPSSLVVVDLDTAKSPAEEVPDGWSRRGARDGRDVWRLLCSDAGHPQGHDTRQVITPSGGQHLYFRAPQGVRLRNTQGESGTTGLGWKVDTRAWGGYVVAVGSITPVGAYYRPDDTGAVATLPGWLVQRLSPRPRTARTAPIVSCSERVPAYVAAAVAGERDRVAQAPPGAHSSTLFVAGVALGQLVGGGELPAATAEDVLITAGLGIIGTPGCRCTEREITRTVRNGLRAGEARPRRGPTPDRRTA
ncbi:bifunctional DNA primase/polymerase [Actinosynnema pretiosum]|nr:bifunctional DNA primase/polymerase [Actinosynnema pretiosum]